MRTAKMLELDPAAFGRPSRGGRWPTQTMGERFWSKVDKSGECWLWTGGINKRGYGLFPVSAGRSELAHRVSSVFAAGPLPARMLVLHARACTSKKCVRPEHLYRGTQKQNMADAVAAGVMRGRNVAKGDGHWMRRTSPRRIYRRTNGRNLPKEDAIAVIRSTCFTRANGRCEACGQRAPQELDHQFGRGKVAQSIENCWALCSDCHLAKTMNHPGRGTWLLKFIAHCGRYGYAVAAVEAQRKLEWYESKVSAGRAL